MHSTLNIPCLLAIVLGAVPLHAEDLQTPQDRADPSVVADELRRPAGRRNSTPPPQLSLEPVFADTAVLGPVLVRAINLQGVSAVSDLAYAAVLSEFAGRSLGGRELEDLVTAIARVAHEQGYGLASAWIPEQAVSGGVLRVEVDEGRIDEVRVSGSGAEAVRAYLEPLANGKPVRTTDLERSLLLAGDSPGVTLGKPRIEQLGGRAILVVRTVQDKVRARGQLDNWGSGPVGPIRTHLNIDIAGLLSTDDRLTVGGVLTPLDLKEFQQVRLAYARALGVNGTSVSASAYAARSRPGGIFSDRGFEGESVEGSVGLEHAMARARDASVWGEVEFVVRDSKQSLDGIVVRRDRLATLNAGLHSTVELPAGNARLRVSASQGLPILDATKSTDPLRSRRDGSAVFTKLNVWADYDQKIWAPFSFQIQAEGQIASRPLLSSEEMGLGGRYFLRGYDYREFSGDKGVAASFELRVEVPKIGNLYHSAQLYGYADAGSVGNYGDGAGGGSLASAGGGIRALFNRNFDAGVEVGIPLMAGAAPEKELDPRISFVIGSRF